MNNEIEGNKIIAEFYPKWCKETNRNGGVLIGKSIKELLWSFLQYPKEQNAQVSDTTDAK